MSKLLSLLQNNRSIVIGVLLILMLFGIADVTRLPVESVPDISPQQVLVSVVAPGLATEEVEKLITFPIEASMSGIPGMIDLRSVSRSGISVVYVQFADDTDINLDRTYVGQRIQAARANISVPGLTINMGPLATGLGEIMQIQIHGTTQTLMDLNRIMTWTVVPQLKLIPGVADVNVNGGAEETFEIALDMARLNAFDLSVGDVFRAVDENNAVSGGAWIEHYAEQQIVAGRGLIRDLDDFGAIFVRAGPNGTALYLRDLGRISQAPRTRLGAVTRDNKGEIVNGVVMMQTGSNSGVTLAAIEEALPTIKKSLPLGVTLEPYYNRGTLTGKTIQTVKENLVIGAALVVFVLLVVIGDWRASLVIASVIPVALICAMVGIHHLGISANLLSLGAIDFGMIVDSSLVVVENTMAHRLREQKGDFRSLVVTSVCQVVRPVSFAILVIMMVYLPILTLTGIEGKMFRPMAQTVIIALMASLAYSILCVPVLTSIVLPFSKPHGDTLFINVLRRRYGPLVLWCEDHPKILFGSTAGIFLFSVFLAMRLGGEFIPQLQEGSLVVTQTRLPSASLKTSLHSVNLVERTLMSFPEVRTVVSNTGTSAIPTDPMGMNETDTFVFLKDPAEWKTASSQEELVTIFDKAVREQVPDSQFSWSQPVQMRMDDLLSGVRTQIAISIYGDDLGTLQDLGNKIVSVLNDIPGAADVAAQGSGSIPFLHVDIDRQAAARLNVRLQDVLDIVEAIGGHIGKPVVVNNALISTQVRLDPEVSNSRDKIAYLRVKRAGGGTVLLSQVARVVVEDGPPRISRDRIQRRMIVQANVRGRDLGSFVQAAQQAVGKQVHMPPGYRLIWEGQFRNLQSAMQRLSIVVPIALALIFGLLVVALSSVRLALLVFVNLPIAATGGIIALVLRGLPFSISAGIGFIALFGVAILNGVVLISYTQQQRKTGKSAAEAAFTAAEERFRPVMATAMVASLGFFPMAFSTNAGAEVERPLATVVIGGLVSSTLLTLLVLPSLYTRFMRKNS
ncbi:efflux RND transporter permease subunit [Beijerinckia indica]|uniref:Heavy metal efflux pump, CzcA family n=1 Tax=Beijerinckia indica subsp. indica (strain ATCC 9039 / DSM 1715 / NCIMB 8712) TaxID=395963 RepID=B2IGL2_BEII9|nr:CusA/CzcA family heavy metal efflux RND transporter [Beijerinckia indica]ACB95773.1 heavy metal efflux pump, CzcA family [Beijerinckia indica subsp. indica ATCC 9039]